MISPFSVSGYVTKIPVRGLKPSAICSLMAEVMGYVTKIPVRGLKLIR